MIMEYVVYFRRKVVINTDPQRRCYYGCNFSEEEAWTEWERVVGFQTREDAEESARTFKKINPRREYKIEEIGVVQ